MDLIAIVKQNWLDDVISVKPFGNGHINGTYVVNCPGKRYLLQEINTNVFRNPGELMHNVDLVTAYLADIIEKTGSDEQVMRIVKTKDGQNFITVEGKALRIYTFIENSESFEIVEKTEDFRNLGLAFGNFAKNLDGFDAKQLYEVIPNFHNTVDRFAKFEASLEKDVTGRAAGVKKEIDFYLARKEICSKITSLLASGEMPVRVTHNDTKLNNVMFSKITGKPVAIVDLDTVMPGSVCYDFGDSIRYGCNTAAEDEPDTGKVEFSDELFEAYVDGYLTGFDKITKIEKENLLWGAILMTYECGMRFLTDYLDGDVYFKTSRPEHNLDRTRTQIRMVEFMEQRFDRLQSIVMNH